MNLCLNVFNLTLIVEFNKLNSGPGRCIDLKSMLVTDILLCKHIWGLSGVKSSTRAYNEDDNLNGMPCSVCSQSTMPISKFLNKMTQAIGLLANTTNGGIPDFNDTLLTQSADNLTETNTTDVNIDTEEIFDELDSFETVMLCLELIIFVPTIFGNTLILVSIRRFSWLQTPLNTLVGNLALSDMLIGVCFIPVHVLGVFLELNKFKIMCLINLTILVTLLLVTLLSMLAISVDRYYSVAFPWKHRTSKRHVFVKMFIPVCWIVTVCFSCIPLLGWNTFDVKDHIKCQLYSVWPQTLKYVLSSTIVFIIVVKIILFTLILNIALNTKPVGYNTEQEVRRRVNKSLAKTYMLMGVSAAFVVCWTPFCVISLFVLITDREDLKIVQTWALNLGLLNSGLNWLIYGLKNEKFRKAFRLVVCECLNKRPVSTASTASMRVSS